MKVSTVQLALRELSRRGYMENVRRILRTNEVLTWQSLLLGVQSAGLLTDTTVNIYDFRRNSANTPSLSHGWVMPLVCQ